MSFFSNYDIDVVLVLRYVIFLKYILKIKVLQGRSFLNDTFVLRKRNCALLHPTDRIKKKVISDKGEGTGQNWYR